MPHYFFHIRDERNVPDLIGMTLSDVDAARREALILVGTLLAEPGRRFWDKPEWSVDVTGCDEHLLFRLTFYRGLIDRDVSDDDTLTR